MDNILDNAVDEYEDNFEEDDEIENNNASSLSSIVNQQPSTPIADKENKHKVVECDERRKTSTYRPP